MSDQITRLRAETSLSALAQDFGVVLTKNGTEWEGLCPFHQERTPSFRIYSGKDGAERYKCFGCQAYGDVLDFVQEIKGTDLRGAVSILGGELQKPNVARKAAPAPVDPYAGIVALPLPHKLEAGKTLALYNPKRKGEPSEWGNVTPDAVYLYRDDAGQPMGYVLRNIMRDGRKETPMVRYVRLPDGRECWSRFSFETPRPLYNLATAVKHPDKQVFIVEGEKCADALAASIKRVVLSWCGGTNGVRHADWSPLAGRSVVLWPDDDDVTPSNGKMVGWETMIALAGKLLSLGCKVKIMDVRGHRGGGWDCADMIAEGASADDVMAFIKDTVTDFFLSAAAGDDLPAARKPIRLFEREWKTVADLIGPVPERDGLEIFGGDVDELRKWVFLAAREAFIHCETGELRKSRAFDMSMTKIKPIVETVNAEGEKKVIKPKASVALLEYLNGAIVSDLMYRPDVPSAIIEREGVQYLNSYRINSFPEYVPDWEAHPAWRVVHDHIHNIIPDGAETLIRWCAYNVQNVGHKITWAPVLIGCEGDGKTSIAQMLQAAMGISNVSEVSSASLFSDFTGWGGGAAIRVLEEIRVAGQNKSAVMDKLKPFITNGVVEVVAKQANGAPIANVTNYLAYSNHLDALAITHGDRRYGVWKTRFRDRAQVVEEMPQAYFTRLQEALREGGVVRSWLLSIDLSDFNPYQAPAMTAAKEAMIEAARSPTKTALLEAIELGGFGVGHDALTTDCIAAVIKEMGERPIPTAYLGNAMRELGWIKLSSTMNWQGKTRRVYYRAEAFTGVAEFDLVPELKRALDLTTDQAPRLDDLVPDRPAYF